jgi:transcriptional regulator with GAF, ATPase, and Fis domain
MHFSDLDNSPGNKNCSSPERQHWRIWCLLTFVTVMNVAVLITAQMLLYSGLITDEWPWQKTHMSLMAVLAVANVGFILYLTLQKKQIIDMQKKLQILEMEKNEKISRNAARLYALTSVSRKMCSETDPSRIFKYITDTCTEIFDCSRASLMLLDTENDELVVRAVSPLSEDIFSGVKQKIGKGIAGYVAEKRKALLLRRDADHTSISGLKDRIDNSISAMVVPIVLRDELVGVVNVTTTNEEVEYNDEDIRALQVFADNAGSFIRHSEQAEWMRKTIERLRGTIKKDNPVRARK